MCERKIEQAESADEMRAAIFRFRFENILVKSVLDSVEYSGMSAEDKYTMLAYHAICRAEELQKMVLTQLQTIPQPIFIPDITKEKSQISAIRAALERRKEKPPSRFHESNWEFCQDIEAVLRGEE